MCKISKAKALVQETDRGNVLLLLTEPLNEGV